MIHKLRLNKEPFDSIKLGMKTIEMRLYDEKRQMIKVGDKIEFALRDDETQTILCEVKGLTTYKNFEELYLNNDKVALGYKPNEVASSDDMNQFYSIQEQKQYGVVAIKVQLI